MSKRRSWIVQAQKVKLPLKLEGDEWLEVRSKLTVGQKRKVEFAGLGDAKPGEGAQYQIGLDMSELEYVRILTWGTDWSFVDANEKPLKFDRERLESLDPEAFESIVEALDAHVEAVYPSKKPQALPAETQTQPPTGTMEVLPPGTQPSTPGERRLKTVSPKIEKTGS